MVRRRKGGVFMGGGPGEKPKVPLGGRIRNTDRKWEILRRLPELGLLSDRKLGRLSRSADILDIPARAVLTRQGEPGDRAYLILEGRATVSIGRWSMATSGPGDVVGAMAMLDPRSRNFSVKASTPMTVLAVGPQGFRDLVAQTPVALLVAIQLARLLGLATPELTELADLEIAPVSTN